MSDISVLIGKIISNIDKSHDEIIFELTDGTRYKMYHSQDCCESVTIDDINGDLNDLLNTPILSASEDDNHDAPEGDESCNDSCTWTFYHIATIKGYVTIKWFGTSNGYYSESVDFEELKGSY